MSRAPGQIDFGQGTEAGLETAIGPGLPPSNQTPCTPMTAAAGEPGTGTAAEAGRLLQALPKGPVCSLKLDQGGHKCGGGGQMLMSASTVISEIPWI